MSNSIGRSLLQSTVLKHQSQRNSSTCITGNTLFHSQATSHIRKSSSLALTYLLASDFRGRRLTVRKSRSQARRLVSGLVQAVLATDTTSELGEKFILGGDIEMQVDVKVSSIPVVEIQLTNTSGNLYLHWGGLKNIKE